MFVLGIANYYPTNGQYRQQNSYYYPAWSGYYYNPYFASPYYVPNLSPSSAAENGVNSLSRFYSSSSSNANNELGESNKKPSLMVHDAELCSQPPASVECRSLCEPVNFSDKFACRVLSKKLGTTLVCFCDQVQQSIAEK